MQQDGKVTSGEEEVGVGTGLQAAAHRGPAALGKSSAPSKQRLEGGKHREGPGDD